MNDFLRWLFFGVLMRFLITILFGVNIRYRSRLPRKGPAIIVANHNSHLDTLVLVRCCTNRAIDSLTLNR